MNGIPFGMEAEQRSLAEDGTVQASRSFMAR